MLLGEHDYYDDNETNRVIARVDKIVDHPEYSESPVPMMDFSLLRLREPVDFDMYPHIRPVCLPFSNEEVVTCFTLSYLRIHVRIMPERLPL